MGDRITFRGRGRELAKSYGGSPPAVSITEPRLAFVKGEITTGTPATGKVACGPGTLYPLEVTPDQLHELFFRVRDTEWTSGTFSFVWDAGGSFGGPFTTTLSVPPSAARPANLIEETVLADIGWGERIIQSQRGFSYKFKRTRNTFGLANRPAVVNDELLIADYASSPDDPADIWRDITDHENGIWSMSQNAFSYLGFENTDSLTNSPSGTGYNFNHAMIGRTVNSNTTEAALWFSGRIAWVDNDDSGDPFSPANQLFVGLTFRLESKKRVGMGVAADIWIDSRPILWMTTQIPGPTIVLDLTSGPVSFPTYCYGYADMITFDGGSGSDFIITAAAFWPYATTTGDPAYSTTTGAPANGGPGA